MLTTLLPSELAPTSRKIDGRIGFSTLEEVLDMPDLKRVQLDSFRWFTQEGLRELFEEISPIQDFTGKNLELQFLDYTFGDPKYSEAECRERDMTFSVPLRVKVRLIAKETGELKEQDIFMGDFAWMTPRGTFVVNGAERVVVSQLVRSPGVYLTLQRDPTSDRQLCYAKLIPSRGAWLEFETSAKDIMSVKVDRKRKLPVTTLLRAIGYGTDDELLEMFAAFETGERQFVRDTIAKDPTKSTEEALVEFYRRLRPGDPPTVENSRSLVNSLFFNARRYDLGRVGRYRMNKRLGLDIPNTQRTLTKDDLTRIVAEMVKLNNGNGISDDIDHLGNRRVRSVGELIQNQFRIGLLRMERVVKERMSIQEAESATPAGLVNIRPVVAAMKEFFGGSQLSQFMDQTNPLAELTHKRRLSALGPGGLNRERAGMDVRDVHHSHYGRVCPIETPEGPNIGLIGSLATFARINEYGFIETPYRRVYTWAPNEPGRLVGRTLAQAVADSDTGERIAGPGDDITSELAERIAALPLREVRIRPFVSAEIAYLSADEEDKYYVAQANSELNEKNELVGDQVEARTAQQFVLIPPERIQYMDVSPKQVFSVATALIPFLEHDDANRALMGANMQRQAVPLIRPESPIVGTGMESQAARDSGQVLMSDVDGEISSVTSREIIVIDAEDAAHTYGLQKYVRTNQGTSFSQRPMVSVGDKVRRGQTLADSSSTANGELALGQNVTVAFMSFDGFNFEDAIILSERVVREDLFTSIHIEKHEIESRDTKLGPEEITRDIPNVGDDTLLNLDENGIIRTGAEVRPGDILVGKITPKGETELTAEERLLRAIFGEKAREVKDTSLRVPHGESGKIVDVRLFSREDNDELPAGVNQLVRVSIAQKRKISEGDKMAGRHGNKGVISRILPLEDMPLLPDGTPVDIILNPIGVPSRMNVGQLLETHLGSAGKTLGLRFASPVFDGAKEWAIEEYLARAWLYARALADRPVAESGDTSLATTKPILLQWLAERGYDGTSLLSTTYGGRAKAACLRIWMEEHGSPTEGMSAEDIEAAAGKLADSQGIALPTTGKVSLRDGRSGEPFAQPVTVGSIYMLKLVHLVEDKIHARSTGPYSLITQQPLGGKAQFGGQRFGEMEVWALEAYGAANILREILTVKSDDVVGRMKTYEAIVKGEPLLEPGVPESFKVLVKELQSLGLSMEVLNEDEEHVQLVEDLYSSDDSLPELGINLTGYEN